MNTAVVNIDAQFPEKMGILFHPSRYKVLYGGRGSGKSWNIARALLIKGISQSLRVLCVRELQTSLADSVHQLLEDQIRKLGLQRHYIVEKEYIKGVNNDTLFMFQGIRRNVTKIQSIEGVDICWAEEAHAITKNSWKILIPTIRKEGSEIWISFNPQLKTDYTYQRFVLQPPAQALVEKVNWRDNPWITKVLLDEKEELRKLNYDEYLNVWEGECITNLEGAIYGEQIVKARAEERITTVRYDRRYPVDTYWDLGQRDLTAIWFVQKIGLEFHFIDYHQEAKGDMAHFVQVVKNKGYTLGTAYLPHDSKAKTIVSKYSPAQIARKLGLDVHVVKRSGVADGINLARMVFSLCAFDQKKCAAGIEALTNYHYGISEQDGQRTREPVHDESSHGSDAFRIFACVNKSRKKTFGALDAVDDFADDPTEESDVFSITDRPQLRASQAKIRAMFSRASTGWMR